MLALVTTLAATTLAASALAPFAPYVGHCWTAELPNGAADRHCLAPVYDGQHMRDTHVVTKDDAPIYAGETIYSDEAGEIVFTYWNSLGGVGRGVAAVDGAALHFSMTMRAMPASPPQSFETDWHRTSRGYDATTGGVTRHFRLDDR